MKVAHLMFHGTWVVSILLLVSTTNRALEYPHSRVVRLSFVEGTVKVARPEVEGWADASVNMPIQEGFRVSTAEGGFAEIEFETGSTALLGQVSMLEFTQLVLAPSGGKINRLRIHWGYATFNFISTDNNFYMVTADNTTLTPRSKSRFRLDLNEDLLLVKVFKGSVEITSHEGTGTVGKNSMLEVRPSEKPVFHITQGVVKDAWDEWVEDREEGAQKTRAQASSEFTLADATCCTRLRGWNPNIWMGWCWYPGYGYVWISTEDLGALPPRCDYGVIDPVLPVDVNDGECERSPDTDSTRQVAPSGGDGGPQTVRPRRIEPEGARRSRPPEPLGGDHRPGRQGSYSTRTVSPPISRVPEVGGHVSLPPDASRRQISGSGARNSRGTTTPLDTSISRSGADRALEHLPSERTMSGSSSRADSVASSQSSSGRSSGAQRESRSSSDHSREQGISGSSGRSSATVTSNSGSSIRTTSSPADQGKAQAVSRADPIDRKTTADPVRRRK